MENENEKDKNLWHKEPSYLSKQLPMQTLNREIIEIMEWKWNKNKLTVSLGCHTSYNLFEGPGLYVQTKDHFLVCFDFYLGIGFRNSIGGELDSTSWMNPERNQKEIIIIPQTSP